MTSVQFVPLLPIVAQVAGIDIYKCKLLENDLKRYIFPFQFPSLLQTEYLVDKWHNQCINI